MLVVQRTEENISGSHVLCFESNDMEGNYSRSFFHSVGLWFEGKTNANPMGASPSASEESGERGMIKSVLFHI